MGSRSTPADVRALFTRVASHLAFHGFGLRSGAAHGADAAFERGAGEHAQIYLPWRGYNDHASPLHQPPEIAYAEAARHHPAWHACSRGARSMHARNCQIVLGPNLDDPSTCVVCWTPDGRASGGTGQAIRTAAAWRIPVMNVYNLDDRIRLKRYLVGPPIPGSNYGARS